MNLKTLPLGVIGLALAVAGAVGYSLVPEKLWLAGLLEGAALLCLLVYFIAHFSGLKAFSARRSTRVGANSLLMILLFILHHCPKNPLCLLRANSMQHT